MPYYCNYNGTGYLTAPTLGNLHSGSPKIRINIKKFKWYGTSVQPIFWQGGTSWANREFVLRNNSNVGNIICGTGSATGFTWSDLTNAFGDVNLTCDEFGFELDGTVAKFYKNGTAVFTVNGVGRGTGRLDGALLFIGAQQSNDTAGSTSATSIAPNLTQYGDIQIFINDVLVRNYVMPSTGATVPDSVGGNILTQRGTWPTDNSEWVFYSSGAYTLTADGATLSYSGGIASTIYNRFLSADGGSFSYSGGVAATLLNRRIAADGATFGYSGGASALLYGRALQAAGGSFSYSGGVVTFVYTPITGYVLNADGGIFSYAGGEVALSFNQNYPTANPNDYTVSAYLATDSTYTARLSESSTINAIISASSTINARLN